MLMKHLTQLGRCMKLLASPKPGPWWKTSARWQVFDLTPRPERNFLLRSAQICWDLRVQSCWSLITLADPGSRIWCGMMPKIHIAFRSPRHSLRWCKSVNFPESDGESDWWSMVLALSSMVPLAIPSSQACCGARVPGHSRTIQKRAQRGQQCECQSCKSNPLNLITSNHQAKHWLIESVQALLHTGLVSQCLPVSHHVEAQDVMVSWISSVQGSEACSMFQGPKPDASPRPGDGQRDPGILWKRGETSLEVHLCQVFLPWSRNLDLLNPKPTLLKKQNAKRMGFACRKWWRCSMIHHDTLVASISFVCLEIDNRSFRGFVEEFNERLQALRLRQRETLQNLWT